MRSEEWGNVFRKTLEFRLVVEDEEVSDRGKYKQERGA